jgi:ribonuclease P protein component
MVRGSRRHLLTGTGAFEAVLRGGRRRNGEYLEVIAMAAAREHGRAGMVIGRKALPRAVDRNRIRRMLRVVLHRARPAIGGFDLIVRLKRGAPRTEFPLIAADAVQLLARLAAAAGAP